MTKANLWQLCEESFSYVQGLRRNIHQHPELGFEVHRTAKLVAQELEAMGLTVKTGVGQTGVVADLTLNSSFRRMALRADMDALPIQEEGSCSYKSQIPGVAHMCGHDAHTAMLVGAAKIICQNRDKIKANIRFIFQPNEENIPGGAIAMVKDGCLEGVDEIYGMHVWPLLPVGKYGLRKGPLMGRPDGFQIKIQGKGGHASMPQHTIDPIVIGAQIVQALQTLVSRNSDPIDNAVVSVTQFHAGTTNNVIPESAFIEGTSRSLDNRVCDQLKMRMTKILNGFAEAFGAKIDLHFEEGYPVLVNSDKAIEYVEACLNYLSPNENLAATAKQVLGGEDFSHYLNKIPGAYIFLGCSNPALGLTRICHDPRFDIDETCLKYGTALHAALALNFK